MITPNTANNILNAFFGKAKSINAPGSTCYMGLSTTTPTDAGGNFTEPSAANGYERSLLGISDTVVTQVMNSASGGAITNGSIIFFPEATASWGTVTHFGLFSSASGGTPFFWGALTTAKEVTAEKVTIVRKEGLKVTLS